ncbi:MAG: HlyD family efflux transporter periplasmic adaptor subunit [Lentisphaerae bacterium]|nr:HlyD family efflux transporter periplasmic adaptor subunit [Lentisphaerota bacterium]MCP4101799.1 HlyD family efflux transporter periplasmic adaptor subunit [Lentisphaerota bacterium]
MKRTFLTLFIAAAATVVFGAQQNTEKTSQQCTLQHDHSQDVDHSAHQNDEAHKGHNHNHPTPPPPAQSTDKEAEHQEEGLIHLSSEQRKITGFKVSIAEKGSINSSVVLPGVIKFNNNRIAEIMPQMPGFVTAIYKSVGDKVKKGETLAVLQSHELGELHADYRYAREYELMAKVDCDMKRNLVMKRAVSEIEYIKARQIYAEAKVNRHRYEDKLKALGFYPQITAQQCPAPGNISASEKICTLYPLKSPISGTIVNKNLTIGENFSSDNTKSTFTVVDLSTVWLDLDAAQKDLPKIKKGLKVTVDLGVGFPDFTGNIFYISSTANPLSRTVLVRVLLKNEKGILKPGLFATAKVTIPSAGQTVLVPSNAILMIDGERVIFVPEDDGFLPQQVTIGHTGKGFTEIVSGLKPGDKYVSKGAFVLKSIMVTSGIDSHAGHGH